MMQLNIMKGWVLQAAITGMVFGILASIVPSMSYGQAVYGSIYGTVTDPTGAAVPGAAVTVTDESKGTVVGVKTNASGNYTVQNLIAGSYDVKVEAPGFETADNPNIRVFVDTAPKVDVTLRVGASSQTVHVSAAASLLKTDRADVSTVLNQKYVSSLPLANRNFTSLQYLLPGAQFFAQAAPSENPQNSQWIDVNGQNFAGVGYQLDGTDNQDAILAFIVINPILDDVTETKMSTTNFDAQFGSAMSALITVSTKSGTNQLHGSAYDYRQSAANLARNPYTQFAQSDVPPGLQSQFGGTIGGPIKKNNLFYFFGYQGLRSKSGISTVLTIPTEKAKSTCGSGGDCDLSDYLNAAGPVAGQLYDPATGGSTAFPGNIIPAGRVNPASINILNLFPDPNTGPPDAIISNYGASGTGLFNANQFDIRIDSSFSEKLHAFGRYSYFSDVLTGAGSLGALGGPGFGVGFYAGASHGRNQSFAGGGDYTIHPDLLTDFRLGYHRYHITTSKYDGDEPFATNLGIPGLNIGGDTGGAPGFDVDGLTPFGSSIGANQCNCPLTQTEDQFQIVNNWTKIAGNHILKFGADLRYARNLRVPSDHNRAGELAFSSSNTSSAGGLGGQGIGALVLGNVTSMSRYAGNPDRPKAPWEYQKRAFFYAQDSWHPTANLTINYGLRYELYFPETVNGQGQGSLLNLDTGNLQVAGYGPYGTNMGISNTYLAFAPRLGIAYQIDPKTVIRAGYGRSFDIGAFGAIFGEAPTQNMPVFSIQSVTAPNVHVPAFTFGEIPPPPFFGNLNTATGTIPVPDGVEASIRPLKMTLPTVDSWNLALQRQVSPTIAVTLAYVGNKGTHVYAGDFPGQNVNQLALTTNGLTFNPPSANDPNVGENPNLPVSPAGDIRRYPYYSRFGWTQSFLYYDPSSNSNYNALQVTVDKQLSHGLQIGGNYAWQKAFRYEGGYYEIDRKLTRGRNPNLRNQALRVYGTWQLPIGRGKVIAPNANRLLDTLIGGWELDTILSLSSGLPYTPSYQNCGADQDTGPNCAPSILQNGSFPPHLGTFDPTTHSRTYFVPVPTMANRGQVSGPFQRPGLAEFGNIANNYFTGPNEFNEDMAFQKHFPIWNRVTATFRVDAFNVFNHINAGQPNACIDCTVASGAGQIFGMPVDNTPRQIQFAARVEF